MSHIALDKIPFDPDLDTLSVWLHIKPESTWMAQLIELATVAQSVARPKVVYRVLRVEEKGNDYAILDGIKLTSRVLRVNLADAHRAFAYVATCGVELEEWARSQVGAMERFVADAIAGAALVSAREFLQEHLEQTYRPGRLGEMNPGSLPDWPLREQRPLFELLGDPESMVGVQLLDSYLMNPTKSTSGLLFSSEEGFYNCQLCPMDGCPGRRAAYDPGLRDRKYGTESVEAAGGRRHTLPRPDGGGE
jgi:hypothetical protein